MAIYSFSPFGYEGALVSVEVDLREASPAIDIVGLADGTVKETRARIKAAINNSKFSFPEKRVLISLSPADVRKEDAGFDLAIALAILDKSECINKDVPVMVMGELGLGGNIRPSKGLWAAISDAKSAGIVHAIIPNVTEELPDGVILHRVDTLQQAFEIYSHITGNEKILPEKEKPFKVEFTDIAKDEISLDEIKGMAGLKYAMAMAVAGGHHILAWGAPSCEKSATMQKMTQLLPKLTTNEKDSVNRVYAIADMPRNNDTRPFRTPHPTASLEGMCGGGINCRPGEITLAHNGVLFLDEATEFRTSVLQMLRVPLETGAITLSRAGRTTTYPAHFRLAMVTSPCPCGNLGSKNKLCLCSAREVVNYWKKISAPLLDRIAVRIDCNAKLPEEGAPIVNGFPLSELREMIKRAWERQYERQGKLNQDLSPQEVEKFIHLTGNAQKRLNDATEEYGYSPIEILTIKKLAQTEADMLHSNNTIVDEAAIGSAIRRHDKLPIEF